MSSRADQIRSVTPHHRSEDGHDHAGPRVRVQVESLAGGDDAGDLLLQFRRAPQVGGEQRGRRLDHPVEAHVQLQRDQLLDGLADGVPALREGQAQRVQGRLPRRAGEHGPDEVGLREPGHEERRVLLGGEVAEEGALRDVGGLGDVVDGRLLVTALGEQFEGGAQQQVPGALLLEFTQAGTGGRGCRGLRRRRGVGHLQKFSPSCGFAQFRLYGR
ncbi:hypothetical protein RKD38_005455 [Streptomyces ambofaciens]